MSRISDDSEARGGNVLSWDEIVEHCSRLHTTRRKPEGPWPDAQMREASEAITVTVAGRLATLVPTRMVEPGFYCRYEPLSVSRRDLPNEMYEDADELRRLADAGQIIVAHLNESRTGRPDGGS